MTSDTRAVVLRDSYSNALEEMLRECTFETFESSFPFLCTTTEDKTFLRDCYDEFVQHIRSFCLYEMDTAMRETQIEDKLAKLDRVEAEQPLSSGGTRRPPMARRPPSSDALGEGLRWKRELAQNLSRSVESLKERNALTRRNLVEQREAVEHVLKSVHRKRSDLLQAAEKLGL